MTQYYINFTDIIPAMKCAPYILLILLYFTKILTINGQSGQWMWMNGDSMSNSPGHFGVQGMASPLNSPPALERVNCWTDVDGKFWIYGGDGVPGHSGDLWKYDPATNMWTWMNGPGAGGQAAVYGTKGLPSPYNNPGYRLFNFCTWTDLSGRLWLFGGKTSAGYLNDLWRFDIPTNSWTWMKGPSNVNDPGHYGQLGIPDSANNPPCRIETTAAWTDEDGNLWMFGGLSPGGTLNDLWKYNVQTNNWTWIKGSNQPNQPGTYGSKGIADPLNTPGGRAVHAHWKDSLGNFMLFGGFSSVSNYFNDLWKYNSSTNNWTWISGSQQANDQTICSGLCDTSLSNVPCARSHNGLCWIGECGLIYNYGGRIGNPLPGTYGYLNDLWQFSVNTNTWTLTNGGLSLDQYATYGTKTIPSPGNQPGGRFGGCSWTDPQGNLWLFGGSTPTHVGTTVYPPQPKNTLWKFIPDTSCPYNPGLDLLSVTADTAICKGDSIQLSASGALYYSWFPDSTLTDPDIPNPVAFPLYNTTYSVTVSNEGCTKRRYVHVTVNDDSPVRIISNDTIICDGESIQLNAAGGSHYQWNNGGNTASIVVQPTSVSTYYITITYSQVCVKYDSVTVDLSPLPMLQFNPGQAELCKGDSVQLSVSGASQYHWDPPSWLSAVSGNIVNARPLTSITYIVKGIDNMGCQNTDSITVEVYPLPQVSVSPQQSTICQGEQVLFTAYGGQFYSWQPALYLSSTSGSMVVASPGESIFYTVTATDEHDCIGKAQAGIDVYSIPLKLPDTAILCPGSSLTLTAGNVEGCVYRWQDGHPGRNYTVFRTGKYWVTASLNNCERTDTVNVLPCTDLWVPNAFTPGGDQVNDIFIAKASTEVKTFEMRIYNRWGEPVFESRDVNTGWDGRYKGSDCPADVYIWTILFQGEVHEVLKSLKGRVTLIR